MSQQKILVVDDEPDIRDVLRITLESEGFHVDEARDGREALELVEQIHPDLVLLDFKIPFFEGPEVCRRLKQDVLLQHTPVIMLTSKGEVADKVQGIEAGADDYLLKPFEPTELMARVRMILRRTTRSLDANPLTKLPGNASIMEELQERLQKDAPMAACYIDLDKFKAYNDIYGFERGDEVIKTSARVLLIAMRDHGNPDDFLGHIGGDDFVLCTSPDKAEAISDQIVKEFAQAVLPYYDEKHRQQGYIEAKDRDGETKKFGFMTVSIAIVSNDSRPITHFAEIAEIGAELKKMAKNQGGSRWVRDRRAEDE